MSSFMSFNSCSVSTVLSSSNHSAHLRSKPFAVLRWRFSFTATASASDCVSLVSVVSVSSLPVSSTGTLNSTILCSTGSPRSCSTPITSSSTGLNNALPIIFVVTSGNLGVMVNSSSSASFTATLTAFGSPSVDFNKSLMLCFTRATCDSTLFAASISLRVLRYALFICSNSMDLAAINS